MALLAASCALQAANLHVHVLKPPHMHAWVLFGVVDPGVCSTENGGRAQSINQSISQFDVAEALLRVAVTVEDTLDWTV